MVVKNGSKMDARWRSLMPQPVSRIVKHTHGGRGAVIEVSNTGIPTRALAAGTLADLLREAGIRWRVVVVSACFSGAFIDPLADDHTIVLTAASRLRTSFGCSDDRDLTYFGEAFYRDAMPHSIYLRDTFEAARNGIRQRERDDDFTPSQPQSYFGPLMEEKLRAIELARQAESSR